MARTVNGFLGTFDTIAALTAKYQPSEYVGCSANIGTAVPYTKAWSDGVTWNALASAQLQALVLGGGNTDLRSLDKWYRGGLSGKVLVLTGDSTTVDTSGAFISRLQYYGATIRRDYLGTTVSQSGTTITSTGAIFFAADAGASFTYGDGTTDTIVSASGFTATVVGSRTKAATSGYVVRNAAGVGNDGAPLSGVTVHHCGDNGQTAAGHIAGTGQYPLSYVVGLQADMYVTSFGINDVRLGSTAQSALQTLLETICDGLAAAKTTTTVLARIPNTLLTTDPGSTGFVSPLGSAQDYSNRMAGAYRALEVSKPGVYLWDTRRQVWGGDTCPATSSLMTDILHPNSLGQTGAADALVKLIGSPTEYQRAQADAAFAASAYSPWTVYPLVLEDARYFEQITSGTINGFGPGYIDITPATKTSEQNSQLGDVLLQDNLAPFALTGGGQNISGAAGYMRISMTAVGTPTLGARVRIFRQRGYGDVEIMARLASPDSFPFAVPVNVVFAGSGNVYINTINALDTRLNDIQATDTLVIQGVTPLLLTGATFGTQSSDGTGYVTIAQAGDKTVMSGKKGYLFGASRVAFRTAGVPVVPRDGQLWYDSASGGSLKVRIGGVVKTVTVT